MALILLQNYLPKDITDYVIADYLLPEKEKRIKEDNEMKQKINPHIKMYYWYKIFTEVYKNLDISINPIINYVRHKNKARFLESKKKEVRKHPDLQTIRTYENINKGLIELELVDKKYKRTNFVIRNIGKDFKVNISYCYDGFVDYLEEYKAFTKRPDTCDREIMKMYLIIYNTYGIR